MPTQQRPRTYEKRDSRRAWQMARRGCKQGPIRHSGLGPHDLSAQDLELVAQHPQLDVLHVQDRDGYERARRAERERHGRETRTPYHGYSQPSPARDDTNIGTLEAEIGFCERIAPGAHPAPRYDPPLYGRSARPRTDHRRTPQSFPQRGFALWRWSISRRLGGVTVRGWLRSMAVRPIGMRPA
jgi:hypothetical protein